MSKDNMLKGKCFQQVSCGTPKKKNTQQALEPDTGTRYEKQQLSKTNKTEWSLGH